MPKSHTSCQMITVMYLFFLYDVIKSQDYLMRRKTSHGTSTECGVFSLSNMLCPCQLNTSISINKQKKVP